MAARDDSTLVAQGFLLEREITVRTQSHPETPSEALFSHMGVTGATDSTNRNDVVLCWLQFRRLALH